MKLSKANGFTKTNKRMMVAMTTWQGIYRDVWEKDGKYYVSHNGEICDVTHAKDKFMTKNL